MHYIKYALLLVVVMAGNAFAADEGDLYRGRTLVTGMRQETRIPGFATCLLDVLAKVSGDARLLRDPRAQAIADRGQAGDLVIEYTYRDRLEGIPIHDEQGSRDRPYDLTVSFDQSKIDAVLKALDRKPWTTERPRLALFLAVRNGPTLYVLSRDGLHGRDQRESLAAASWQIGMPVVLPDEALLTKEGLDAATLPVADLAALTRSMGGDLALIGTLTWNKGTLGWAASWQLPDRDRNRLSEIRDVNFDDAFRAMLRTSALILSGNGEP